MPVVRRFGFGKITSIRKADGMPYEQDAFRLEYVDKPGLVLFYESFNKCPGQYFLYLYPYCEDHLQTYFHSSCGDLAVNRKEYTLRTGQSIYMVQEDPMCLSADQKMDVMLNSATISFPEAESEMEEWRLDKTRSLYSVYIRHMTKDLPESLLSAIADLRSDGDIQKVSEEIDRCLHDGRISSDQARYINNKYVNFSRIGRDYYV